MELDITAYSTDDGIKDFLGREATKVSKEMQKLERKLHTLSRKKPSGRLRRLTEVSQNREGIEADINKKRADLEILQGRGRQPIKIKMEDQQVVNWERLRGDENEWMHYVGDERPEILGFSTKERALLQRIFMSKYALVKGRRGAIDEYEELLYELRESGSYEKLLPYREEISQRLSRL